MIQQKNHGEEFLSKLNSKLCQSKMNTDLICTGEKRQQQHLRSWEGTCFLPLHLGSILSVPYMSTGFAGCSVGSGISCGARKLARTPPSYQKKKKKKAAAEC
jgi:hypothetical protein